MQKRVAMSNLSRLLLLSLTFPLVMQPAFGGERIQEATKRLQIAYDVDVVIAGGSVPAVAAAVSIAEKGHSVFLLTDRPYLGEDVCMHLAYLMPRKRRIHC
jgi:heterodisulfide reductase subunit A-like polyferredoxin